MKKLWTIETNGKISRFTRPQAVRFLIVGAGMPEMVADKKLAEAEETLLSFRVEVDNNDALFVPPKL